MKKIKSPLIVKNEKSVVKRRVILGYTFIFIIMSALIFGLLFARNGRSLVANIDGLSQHCVVLAYYGKYLRTVLKNIFVNHTFVIPMFDFSIGMGSDIVSTLHYYGVGDPLNLLSVFVSPEKTEYLYDFLIILRMYLAGITFSMYMLYRNSHTSAVITGAFSYAFCGFAMSAAVRHPFFMTGLIYCPLIFLGIDKILKKESPLTYIISLALTVMTNFYFAYMTCIIMLVYAALSYFSLRIKKESKRENAKEFFKTLGKFALFTVNAFLISMIIFLPQVKTTLSGNRLNTDNAVPFFYPLYYYAGFADMIINPSSSEYWTLIGFTGISLLCVILCFVRIRKHKNIAIAFSLATFAALLPVFGHIFNGFAYVTNRWSWIFSFIASVAVTIGYDELFELEAKEKRRIWIISALYLGVVCCLVSSRSETSLLALAFMFAVMCLVTVYDSINIRKIAAQRAFSVFLAAAVFMQAFYLFDFREGNAAKDAILTGDLYNRMAGSTTSAFINRINDNSEFYRYDDYDSAITENAALLADRNSTSFYYSVANPVVSEFITELGLNFSIEQRWLNFDNRYILQSLSGCKYASGTIEVPKIGLLSIFYDTFTFHNQLTLNSDYETRYYKGYSSHGSGENQTIKMKKLNYYMPMGYTYDTIMSREEYEKLTPIEKQNVLLQTAVTDGTDVLPKAQIRTEDVKQYDIFELLKASAEKTDGISVDGHNITVRDTSKNLEIEVPVSIYSECSAVIDGLKYTDISPYEKVRDEVESEIYLQQKAINEEISEGESVPYIESKLDPIAQRNLERAELFYSGPNSVQITVKSSYLKKSKQCSYFTPKNPYYSGTNTFAIYLGTTMPDEIKQGETDTIKISFSHTGTYTMDNFLISYQSLENIPSDYHDRTENILENVEITDNENTVKGTISLDKTKILAVQIPYSDGWKVKVDGNEAELLNINTMFSGVLLDAGEHTVEFHYTTPYAAAAAAMTLIGTAFLPIIAIIFKRRKKSSEEKEKNDGTPID